MIKFYLFLAILLFLFSCTSISDRQTVVQMQQSSGSASPQRSLPVERPQPSNYIMGKGNVCGEKLMLFLLYNNPQIDYNYTKMLAGIYIEESAIEGVNHDIAFAQMCLETGFLGFGGLVLPDWNNFAGLGAIGPEQPGLTFPDPRTGVRAHIQHLKSYASEEPLNLELVNPRRRFVRLGSSPAIEGLAGTWAADKEYAVKINTILQRLYDFTYSD